MTVCCICNEEKVELSRQAADAYAQEAKFKQKAELAYKESSSLTEKAHLAHIEGYTLNQKVESTIRASLAYAEEAHLTEKALLAHNKGMEFIKEAALAHEAGVEFTKRAEAIPTEFGAFGHIDYTMKAPLPDPRFPKNFKLFVLRKQTPELANCHYQAQWCQLCHEKTQTAVKEFFSQFPHVTTPIPRFCPIKGCRKPIAATCLSYIGENNPVFLKPLSACVLEKNQASSIFTLRVTPYLSRELDGSFPICVVYHHLEGAEPTEGLIVANDVISIEQDTDIRFQLEGTKLHPVVIS